MSPGSAISRSRCPLQPGGTVSATPLGRKVGFRLRSGSRPIRDWLRAKLGKLFGRGSDDAPAATSPPPAWSVVPPTKPASSAPAGAPVCPYPAPAGYRYAYTGRDGRGWDTWALRADGAPAALPGFGSPCGPGGCPLPRRGRW